MPTYIPVVGQPNAVQRALFAQAKRSLQITDPLQFKPAEPGDVRVLSFAERPDFLCDYGIVKSEVPENIRDALAWIVGIQDSPRVVGWAKWLSFTLDAPVREVADVPYTNPEPR